MQQHKFYQEKFDVGSNKLGCSNHTTCPIYEVLDEGERLTADYEVFLSIRRKVFDRMDGINQADDKEAQEYLEGKARFRAFRKSGELARIVFLNDF